MLCSVKHASGWDRKSIDFYTIVFIQYFFDWTEDYFNNLKVALLVEYNVWDLLFYLLEFPKWEAPLPILKVPALYFCDN